MRRLGQGYNKLFRKEHKQSHLSHRPETSKCVKILENLKSFTVIQSKISHSFVIKFTVNLALWLILAIPTLGRLR